MIGHAERIWLSLLALTAAGAWLGETGQAGWPLACLVAALILVKGRLVADHYMELGNASPAIRRVVHAFVAAVPAMVLASQMAAALRLTPG